MGLRILFNPLPQLCQDLDIWSGNRNRISESYFTGKRTPIEINKPQVLP